MQIKKMTIMFIALLLGSLCHTLLAAQVTNAPDATQVVAIGNTLSIRQTIADTPNFQLYFSVDSPEPLSKDIEEILMTIDDPELREKLSSYLNAANH